MAHANAPEKSRKLSRKARTESTRTNPTKPEDNQPVQASASVAFSRLCCRVSFRNVHRMTITIDGNAPERTRLVCRSSICEYSHLNEQALLILPYTYLEVRIPKRIPEVCSCPFRVRSSLESVFVRPGSGSCVQAGGPRENSIFPHGYLPERHPNGRCECTQKDQCVWNGPKSVE